MKNKKLLLLLALALVSVFTIVGCGNSAPANKKAETKAEPAKGLVEQWKDTGHSKFFAYWVSQGVDGAAKAHYGDKCINCHSAVTKIDDPNAKFADFLQGGKYAGKTEGVSCRVCHKLGGEDGIQLNTPGWDSCANCHTGGTPTLGSEVHHPQGEMIKGVAIKGSDLPAMPSFKYANMKDDFACYSCHVTNGSKHDFLVIGDNVKHDKDGITRISATLDYNKFKETFTTGKTLSGKSCNTCHSDSSSVINKIKTTQANTSKKLEELKKSYEQLSKKYADVTKGKKYADITDPKVKAFMEGSTYYTFVEADSSKGAHNPEYAKALLDKAEAKFKDAQ